MSHGAPANFSEIDQILWPLTLRIVLDECARDAMRLEPRGCVFPSDHQLAADSLVAAGLLAAEGHRYRCTQKGWDCLGRTIFKL